MKIFAKWSSFRRGRWIHVLAVLAVLAHAGVLVHHRVALAAQSSEQVRLLADLGVICSPAVGQGGTAQDPSPGQFPQSPQPQCPVCLGQSSSAAILPSTAWTIAAAAEGGLLERPRLTRIGAGFDPAWPRGRGPPRSA